MTARNVSTYKPEYCEAIIEHCRQGGSIETFGPTIGKVKQTIYNWRNTQPDFADACAIALGLATFEDEKVLHQIIQHGDKDKKLGALIYRLGNRAPDVWRNVQRTEITGAEGGPLQTVQRVERHVIDPKG